MRIEGQTGDRKGEDDGRGRAVDREHWRETNNEGDGGRAGGGGEGSCSEPRPVRLADFTTMAGTMARRKREGEGEGEREREGGRERLRAIADHADIEVSPFICERRKRGLAGVTTARDYTGGRSRQRANVLKCTR